MSLRDVNKETDLERGHRLIDELHAEAAESDEEFEAHMREVAEQDDISSEVLFSAVARRYMRNHEFKAAVDGLHFSVHDLNAKIDHQRRKLKVEAVESA